MKKYLFIYTVVTTVVIIFGGKYLITEQQRHRENSQALMQSVELFRTQADEAAASVQVLRLRCGEYEELRAKDAAKIRELGIKIRRLESAAKSVTQTVVEVKVPIVDTVVVRDTLHQVDTVRLFRWQDSWVTIDGTIFQDSVACSLKSVDTLRQTVHRVPRRFLFFKFGTKALRQSVVSSNPHTEIVYSEYIDIIRR